MSDARRWIVLTFAGWSLGFVLILVCIALSGMVGLGEMQFPIGLGMGAGVGFMQRRLIADRLHAGRAWLYASIVGLTAPFVVHDIEKAVRGTASYALTGAVVLGGLAVGLLQWRVLRPFGPHTAWWVPASVVGWGLAASMVVVNDKLLPKTPGVIGALIYIAVVLVGGVLLGGATAPVLQRILAGGRPS